MANTHARLQEEEDDSIEKTFASFYDYEEDDLHEIVSMIVTDQIIESMQQRRLVWVRNRSLAFTEISASWDNLEWKRNFGSTEQHFAICALHSVLICIVVWQCVHLYLWKRE